MKRFLAFYGMVYYPLGGMEDFLSDHNTLEEAMAAIKAKSVEENWGSGEFLPSYEWAHVWDCVERKIVYVTDDDNGEALR